jgi:hypothetical protein
MNPAFCDSGQGIVQGKEAVFALTPSVIQQQIEELLSVSAICLTLCCILANALRKCEHTFKLKTAIA